MQSCQKNLSDPTLLNGSVWFYVTSSVKLLQKGDCSKKHENILNIHADLRTGATFLNVSVPAAETVYVIDTAW